MRVEKDHVVSIFYTLYDESGDVLEEVGSEEPFWYLHGYENIIPQLEAALEDLQAGDEFEVHVAPTDAYGEYNPQFQQRVNRTEFPEDMELSPGMAFELVAEDDDAADLLGPGGSVVFYVKEVFDDEVVIDANHPMAGHSLHFKGKVMEVRPASEDEVDHGHAHVPGMHP